MIHNQGPLFLDLVGTCHSELVKPAVLLAKHLDNYQTHVERGFSVYPPEQLNDLRREGRLELDDAGALMAPVVSTCCFYWSRAAFLRWELRYNLLISA